MERGVFFEHQYKSILSRILENGQKRDVRGFKTLELSPFVFSIKNPLCNVLTNPIRKVNKAFMIAEWLWMMSGRNDVKMVGFYNSKIAAYSDNGVSFKGAYGPRIIEQLDYIFECFKKDMFTRQAIIQIWNENPKHSKDIPCTLTFQFLQNDLGELDMIANMRSNDAWLGLPYDFFNFTMIQNYLAFKLGLKIGRYTHIAGSLHLYSEHFDIAKSSISNTTYVKEISETAPITQDELCLLKSVDENIRVGQDCQVMIDIMHEPWKSMATELKKCGERKLMSKQNV